MRDKKIDFIKGMGIMLVVLGHTQMFLCGFVNLFHVGLFFMASGYCYKERYSDSFDNLKLFLKKRIKGLYIPFVLWNIGYLCFRNLFGLLGIYDTSFIGFAEFIKQAVAIVLLQSGEQLAGASWFVRALFILEVLFVIVDYFAKHVKNGEYVHVLRWVIAVAMLVMGGGLSYKEIILPDNISTVCSAWILFVIGLELKNIKENRKIPEAGMGRTFVKLMVCVVALVVLGNFGTISYDSNRYPNVIFFLIAAVCGWGFVWNLALLSERKCPRVLTMFSFVGERTMDILFLHLLCFKIVSFVYVVLHGVDRSDMAAFPVATVDCWYWYFLVGIVCSLIVSIGKQYIKKWIGRFNKKRQILLVCAICAAFLIVPNAVAYISSESMVVNEKNELDYSLVYDEQYYLENNPDIAQTVGEDSERLLEHFKTNGMSEARVASAQFDVYYYRKTNNDLEAEFGDDWEKYYLHYIQFGYEEGRNGTSITTVRYDCELICEVVDDTTIEFDIDVNNDDLLGKDFYILKVPSYDEFTGDEEPITKGKLKKEQKIEFKEIDFTNELNDKYIVVTGKTGSLQKVSNEAYISNAELLCHESVERPQAQSKKGLQIAGGMLEDAEELNPSYPFMNLVIQNIMTNDAKSEPVIIYNYKGEEYYFLEQKIEEYDHIIGSLTEDGALVTTSVISIKKDGFDQLYYPGIDMDTGASYYAVNTSSKEGTEYLEAFVSFMSQRYNGANGHGLIANWVVGNEVNESGTYNYMGEKVIDDYLKEYTRTFRIIYNVVKSNNQSANVYVPMEPWWGISSNMLTYGGEEFLTLFCEMMSREGDIDWGLAYHAYSFPLSDPKVLNDGERTIDLNGEFTLEGYVTTESEKSVTITMNNIEVLVEFMKQDAFLNKNGEVRSIILSEQGYTSNSNLYGQCEAQQAASMVYAYYKAEMIDELDAFIYFLQADTEAAALGNDYYLFGLWGIDSEGNYYPKMSYDVFRVMDTKDSLEQLSYIKDILGIKNWKDVINNFDESVFFEFCSVDIKNKGNRKDISKAVIGDIPEQEYSGRECLPEIDVIYNGRELKNDEDYDIVYLNNVEPGEAEVVVVGINQFSGICKSSFKIVE